LRLGLMGGTFDPVHNGHLQVARAAAPYGLDRVALVPARRPPHKDRDDMADPYHRFAMAALAAAGDDRICVSSHEVARDGPSYTIDTVRHFAGRGHDVTLILGSDSLAELETWRECRALLDLARLLVYPRRPYLGDPLESRLPGWIRDRRSAGAILWLDGEPVETSSTQVRALLRAGGSAQALVPQPVERYILKHRLYTGGLEGATE
jgi:nicotinate-nucleotide adenylyltransferase